MMKLASMMSAATLLATTPAFSATLHEPLVSPSAGSDAILALHPLAAGELRLQYRVQLGADAPVTVIVGVSGDYHYIDSPDALRIYDYKLRRIFSLLPNKSFVDDSLYADVWLRSLRTTNSLLLARVGSSSGRSAPDGKVATADQFWIETEFGVLTPELPRPELRQVTDDKGVHFMFAGEEAALVKYENELVPDEIKASLRHLWPTMAQVHPAIADALASARRIPAEMWLKQRPWGVPLRTVHWTLMTMRWVPVARLPLPPHLSAHPTTDAGAYPQVFATLAGLISERKIPPIQVTYRLRVESALDRRAGLEAILWLIEMNLARGPPVICSREDSQNYCELWSRADRLAKTDPRISVAFVDRAPAVFDRDQFDTLPNAYMLRYLWATLPPDRTVTRGASELDLLAALRVSPVANFCKDVGVFYASQGQPFAAWQTWDLGRLMAGHVKGDLLDSIDTLESELSARQPAFF